MSNDKLMEDMMKLFGGALHQAGMVKDESMRMVEQQGQAFLQRMHLVTRDEHEAVLDMARQALEKITQLEARLEALEAAKASPAAKPSGRKKTGA